MKRYKNIDLDYGVNTALMEAYSAMLAEEEEAVEEIEAEDSETEEYSEEVYDVDPVTPEGVEAPAVEEGIASEIFEFEE
jgi:hypothetical protein